MSMEQGDIRYTRISSFKYYFLFLRGLIFPSSLSAVLLPSTLCHCRNAWRQLVKNRLQFANRSNSVE